MAPTRQPGLGAHGKAGAEQMLRADVPDSDQPSCVESSDKFAPSLVDEADE